MTKQEEIKEGLISTLGKVQADITLSYLHSQGVVIQIEGELPNPPYIVSRCTRDSDINYGFLQGRDAMLNAGYVAVEPLIKE